MIEILSPEIVAAFKVIADQYHIGALQEMCEGYEELRRYAKLGAIERLEAEQILGKALGYSWYKDDPKNFPDATESDGVCTGEHTLVTIAMEAASAINMLRIMSETRLQNFYADLDRFIAVHHGLIDWEDAKK